MFVVLLMVTFVIALLVSAFTARLFRTPVLTILERIIKEEISAAWARYMTFAIYVVGVSGGVRVWDLEKYISPRGEDAQILVLNSDRWILEVYRTAIGTLQSIAWVLLIFFVFALVAYVIVKGSEMRKAAG